MSQSIAAPVTDRSSSFARNPAEWRRAFPILGESVHGKPLVYLDNAATTQKPLCVIEREAAIYRTSNANIHRGVYAFSQATTEAYAESRRRVARFLGAASDREVVYTSGTTGSINLVAQCWGRSFLKEGDEILLTEMEHHANIVPWQVLAAERGLRLRFLPVEEDGSIQTEVLQEALERSPRLVAFTWVSNSLGTINPARDWVRRAKAAGATVLVDAAQAVALFRTEVAQLGADFLVFSGHKCFAPTGIGVLWGREELLNAMPPYQTGGDMIQRVTLEKSTFKSAPQRFEAGTPNYVGAIALGEAIRFLEGLDAEAVWSHEEALLKEATAGMEVLPGLRILGTAPEKAPIISFLLEGVHPHDIATFMDQEGIALRAGHHCTQPLMQRFGVAGTARISFSLYNDHSDVARFLKALDAARRFFLP